MITALWSGLGGKLGERWAAALFSPALAFWAAGAGAWLWTRPGSGDRERVIDDLAQLSSFAQAVVVVGALLVVAASAVVVERLAFAVIRVLEGYWPRWLHPLRRRLTKRKAGRKATEEKRWEELYARWDGGDATAKDIAELLALERRLSESPADEQYLMPTRLGNLLRAAESRPYEKYGLETVRCWPRMWIVLPDSTKQELTAARANLDTAATWWTWGFLLAVWTIFTPVALAAAFAAAWLAYRAILGSAARFGELTDATFDVHRGLLYDALGYPRPDDPNAERAAGEALSQLIVRGPDVPARRPTPSAAGNQP